MEQFDKIREQLRNDNQDLPDGFGWADMQDGIFEKLENAGASDPPTQERVASHGYSKRIISSLLLIILGLTTALIYSSRPEDSEESIVLYDSIHEKGYVANESTDRGAGLVIHDTDINSGNSSNVKSDAKVSHDSALETSNINVGEIAASRSQKSKTQAKVKTSRQGQEYELRTTVEKSSSKKDISRFDIQKRNESSLATSTRINIDQEGLQSKVEITTQRQFEANTPSELTGNSSEESTEEISNTDIPRTSTSTIEQDVTASRIPDVGDDESNKISASTRGDNDVTEANIQTAVHNTPSSVVDSRTVFVAVESISAVDFELVYETSTIDISQPKSRFTAYSVKPILAKRWAMEIATGYNMIGNLASQTLGEPTIYESVSADYGYSLGLKVHRRLSNAYSISMGLDFDRYYQQLTYSSKSTKDRLLKDVVLSIKTNAVSGNQITVIGDTIVVDTIVSTTIQPNRLDVVSVPIMLNYSRAFGGWSVGGGLGASMTLVRGYDGKYLDGEQSVSYVTASEIYSRSPKFSLIISASITISLSTNWYTGVAFDYQQSLSDWAVRTDASFRPQSARSRIFVGYIF